MSVQKEKTAMMMLIEALMNNRNALPDTKAFQLMRGAYENSIAIATELLATEKKNIVDAHIAGQKFAFDNDNPDSEEYYQTKYGNQ